MAPELWTPGHAGPVEDFVDRLHRTIERFASDEGVEKAYVQVELIDGSRLTMHSLSPEPGSGFVTIRPHAEDSPDAPGALVVPVGAIKRIELDRADEQRAQFGFALRAE